jgi:hypothetical protein
MTEQSPSLTSQPSRQNRLQRSTPNANAKQRFGKGKSKYAQKRNKAKAPVVVNLGPVKDYTSVCCGVPAVKPPCGKKVSTLNSETKKMNDVTLGLGTWRCSGCHKVCKVTVSKHKEAETTVPTTTVSHV